MVGDRCHACRQEQEIGDGGQGEINIDGIRIVVEVTVMVICG